MVAIDLQRAVDIMKTALLRQLGDEVDLIFLYGSFLKGTAHRYSDLDISYTPVHESTWNSITVMVGGVLIDLYPMHWSTLESMANFDNISATLLLESRLVYQRSEESASRFRALADRLHALQQPEARPEMLRKAQALFQKTGYEVYLQRQQTAAGHWPACLLHAQHILNTVLHSLMIANQAVIDTRKLPQVLALPVLPADLAGTVQRISLAQTPGELLAACETLLLTARKLLLAEQRQTLRSSATFAAVFNAFYPELKADLQKLLVACERQDRLTCNHLLASIDHEVSIHLAKASTGVEYSGFTSLAEYEQDLAALGFPALFPASGALDFAALPGQVMAFDRRLGEFLREHGVGLNAFDTLEDLQQYLDVELAEK